MSSNFCESSQAGRGAALNKQTIIRKIIEALSVELGSYTSSAKTAFAAATDEQSKAENKYDTRALEASYLARGQSIQALEIMRAIHSFETMPVRDFDAKAKIETGALVEVKGAREISRYFLANHGGGTEVEVEGKSILVITPGAPMAVELIGKKRGDFAQIKSGRSVERFEILAVV
jgi:transcription elongation GreA/GreB family factor